MTIYDHDRMEELSHSRHFFLFFRLLAELGAP